jgi:NAD(P)-dependent dehydrogenase (short-subunit alcohol dehydrogenase family)
MAKQELNGKVIVITGASSGFGKGAALKFAEANALVVLAARRDPLLSELASQYEAKGGRALVVHTDVSKSEEVENLAQEAIAAFGRIDVWINNAGAGHKVVPIPPVYEPEQVIDTLVQLATDPKDEVAVGGASGPGYV